MDPWALLEDIKNEILRILGTDLLGVYAHGSLAFGQYYEETSDIDFLIVVERAPDDIKKIALIRLMLDKTRGAPKKGLEMSVVLAKDCARPTHPMPYCLHFSNMHIDAARADTRAYVERMQGEDADLIAHVAVAREVGAALYGPPAREVFGAARKADIMASILCDVGDAEREITQNPAYFALNLCRALAFAEEGKLLSKDGGGAWALERLSGEHKRFAERALNARGRAGAFEPDPDQARAFAAYILNAISLAAKA